MATSFYLLVLILLVLIPASLQITALPWQVTTAMASREIRYHHFVWHNIRNLWNSLNATTQAQIASYGWTPPRPAKDANGVSLKENNSGQDFLYFHRKMIANVQYLMNQSGHSNLTLWNVIPSKNNATYPMPKNYTTPSASLTTLVGYYKSDTWYTYVKQQEKKLTDPAFLKNMTLGEFGSYLEFASDVHQGLHFRFSEEAKLMRVKSNVVVPWIDTKWDVNTSDWLVDVYSSQVNPWFWKMHGWIDNRINDWQKAHGLKNIVWNGTWLGGSTANLPKNDTIPKDPNDRFLGKEENKMDMGATTESDMGDMHGMGKMNITELEEVAKILIGTGLAADHFNELDKKDLPNGWSKPEDDL